MEEKINIAAILKDKSNGLRLYSPIFGECEFCHVRKDTNDICVKKYNDEKEFFDSKGLYYNTGEVMLFPSKEMRDWSKFFNKGDVLVYIDGKCKVIFDKFDDDKYTSFIGKHYLESYGKDGELQDYEEIHCGSTVKYTKESEEAAQTYINTIEERLGGKLNHETLEIENAQPEFKDGDIIKMTWDKYSAIVIFWKYSNFGKGFDSHVFFNIKTKIIEYNIHDHIQQDAILRLATEEEKKQLFSALEKEGKRWDSDKKAIVDLKPKCKFKPFDKVVVRDTEYSTWCADLFSHIDVDYRYACVGATWNFCIHYNEETAHLLGTTDEWKGGEQ